MRTLLDTHSLLWFIGGSDKLSADARARIENKHSELLVSIASLWEIAIKNGLGKLTLEPSFQELIPRELEQQQIGILGISIAHLTELVRLPMHHRDPFDRLISAQALAEDIPVISVDPVLDAYGVRRIW